MINYVLLAVQAPGRYLSAQPSGKARVDKAGMREGMETISKPRGQKYKLSKLTGLALVTNQCL